MTCSKDKGHLFLLLIDFFVIVGKTILSILNILNQILTTLITKVGINYGNVYLANNN